MDEQRQQTARVKNVGMILIWLGLLIFFVYSYQAIMDLEGIGHPGRQKSIARILTTLSTPNLFDSETRYQAMRKMWETIQLAFLATTFSAILAIPFTFFSARASSGWKRGFNIFLQLILAAVRAVHPLIIVIPAVVLTGIGPTAGVLALTLFSTAVLIVKFSEYAQQHASLSWPALFKVYFPGLAFKHFPVNILIATILGIYGGGGIGFLLSQQLNLLNYRDAGVSILAIIITIGSLDLLSRAVWHKIQSTRNPSTPLTPH
jgi:phosphonate transport system permease protein